MRLSVGLLMVLPALALSCTDGEFCLLRTSGKNHYEAGLEHGRGAKHQIHQWLYNTTAMEDLNNWVATPQGSDAFEQLKKTNGAAFPQFVAEMKGMADGAGVPVRMIWLNNLLYDLGNIRRVQAAGKPAEHCTDIFARSLTNILAHGHNEDGGKEAASLFYWVSQEIDGYVGCAGLSYPGMLIGYAPTWNDHGMYMTQNSLHPNAYNISGLAATFVQKEAICGSARSPSATNLDEAIQRLSVSGWNSAASLNLVDWKRGDMANLEVFQDRVAVYHVESNYSHENMFKQPQFLGMDVEPNLSTVHRQARLDSLPAPVNAYSIVQLLGDTNDTSYPIYRAVDDLSCVDTKVTFTSVLLVAIPLLGTAELTIWERSNPADTDPVTYFDLTSFFNQTNI